MLSLLYTVHCNFQVKENQPPAIPSHCCNKFQASALHFILHAHLPILHVKAVQCLPSQKIRSDVVCCGYEKSYVLFHYTASKDIFTILKEQAKEQLPTQN